MFTAKFFRLHLLVVTTLMAVALANQGQAQSSGSIGLLREAYAALARADHDYDGNRIEAMKHIHAAIGELGGGTSSRAHAAVTIRTRHARGVAAKDHEAQGSSDAQLRSAQNLLQQASSELTGRARQQLNAAVAHLNKALSIR